MDLELVPISYQLFGLVTLEIDLLFGSYTKTLFQKNLWEWRSPKISKTVINVSTKEPDESPPTISAATDTGRDKRSIGKPACEIEQLIHRDYTDPAFEIAIEAEDDKSNVKFFIDVGTIPGSNNALSNYQLGGAATVITTDAKFLPTGVPLYFTMYAENSAGMRSSVECQLDTYDTTLPSGRVHGDFRSSSNPDVLKASVLAHDDSIITDSYFGLGYGPGRYGDQIVPWMPINLNENIHVVNDNEPLSQFAEGQEGKLVSTPIKAFTDIPSASLCAKECLKISHCTGFNFDYDEYRKCELLREIQDFDVTLSKVSFFYHFERHGNGHTKDFIFDNMNLQHNYLYYYNLDLTNHLGYRTIIHSKGLLIDLTAPEPGPVHNVSYDEMDYQSCEVLLPPDRPDMIRYCTGVKKGFLNHRTIIDGEGSATVFNGDEPLFDLRFTRNAFYIAGNWNGFRDNETGILVYSMSVGRDICEDWIHPHHDPHKHLLHSSEWMHKSIITESSIDNVFPLPSGRYYISVRALNKVEYGGPHSTTVCHSMPYIIDVTEPVLYEIFDIKYDEDLYILSLEHNSSDPESFIARNELCLGVTTRDCSIMDWVTLDLSPILSIEFQIPDGIPAWIRLRLTNNVQLYSVGRSDQAIIVDKSPPIKGGVCDGTIFRHDMQYTKYSDKICANWYGFYDTESSISFYAVGAGTSPGLTDVAELKEVTSSTFEICIYLNETNALIHNNLYYFVVWAYNGGINQLNTTNSSNGVRVDLTKPEAGEVVDGKKDNFTDIRYSSSQSTVQLQWRDFFDPESGISEYSARVWRKRNDEDWLNINSWTPYASTLDTAEWRNFNLKHKDIVKSELKTTNGALNDISSETDSFIVDLTPPVVTYINDGMVPGSDINFQYNTTALSVNFDFIDEESGVSNIKLQILEMEQNVKHVIYPSTQENWLEINHDINEYTINDLEHQLNGGRIYYIRLSVGNGAGLISTVDTNGVLIDTTPPVIHFLHVGVFTGEEEIVDGYVWQSDHNGIKVSWISNDPESGITNVKLAVGTTPGGTDASDWANIALSDTNAYIHVNLLDTDLTVNSPVYYVSCLVQNGAELESNKAISTPIIVVPEDVAGISFDGPFNTLEEDIDYQADAHTVTTKFQDFESSLHGLKSYDWAIGTTPGGEDILPYIEYGIHHEEQYDDTGHGYSSSGLTHMSIDLDNSETYYITLRVITNGGNVLQTTTDGFVVDNTSPMVHVNRVGSIDEPLQTDTIYQNDEWLTSEWLYHDNDKLQQDINDNIEYVRYSVGTYPYSQDLHTFTYIDMLPDQTGNIGEGHVRINKTGIPNILSINVRNKANLDTDIYTAAVVLDMTSPNAGTITCPSFVQSHSPIKCDWFGFTDDESIIVEYILEFGSQQGFNDISEAVHLHGNTSYYISDDISKDHTDVLYATLTAINSVGMINKAYSEVILVDDTPPVSGIVVELSTTSKIDPFNLSKTVSVNRRACTSILECEAIDAVCIESLEYLSIAWALFSDPESDIVEYQIAIGTTPGGGQVLPYFSVSNEYNQYTITGLNLNGHRQIFATVKAVTFAGLATSSTSNGVYISYLSQQLPPLQHVGIYDAHRLAFGDVQYQDDKNSIEAGWDTSGDPCPVVKYEWSIEGTDGEIIQDFVDVGTSTYEVNNQVRLEEGSRYYNLLRVTNLIGYKYTTRSDGVTINANSLIPGYVYDGNITAYDLTVQQSRTMVSANWDGFGRPKVDTDFKNILTGNAGVEPDIEDNQEVAYYMVAIGTDRRFPKTRDNIVPFTNVWLNTTVTFRDLSLEPGHSIYYFTVRGYSASYSYATAVSNGFYVSFNGGVTSGEIILPDFIDSDSQVTVRWDGYTSEVDILLYYVAISSELTEMDEDCRKFVDGGRATDEQKAEIFDVYPVTNVGLNTFSEIDHLNLLQNNSYFVWILGVDKAGECNMTYHKFIVDITNPSTGYITAGPFPDMSLAYTVSHTSIPVKWDEFVDYESGIDVYDLTLWYRGTCKQDLAGSSINTAFTTVSVFNNFTQYTFTNLTILKSTVYEVSIDAINKAGLKSHGVTSPIVYDNSVPTGGHVTEGLNFMSDVVWWGSVNHMNGSFLHKTGLHGNPCPSRKISMLDEEWLSPDFTSVNDQSGHRWYLDIRSLNIKLDSYNDVMTIKIKRDSKADKVLSGAYIREAQLFDGGLYEIWIQSAGGEGNAVTGVTFFDGDLKDFTIHTIDDPIDWTENSCTCCFSDIISPDCTCNCTEYLAVIEEDDSFDNLTIPPANITANTEPPLDDQIPACGIQLQAGPSSNMVTWCRFKDPDTEMMSVSTNLLYDPSISYHHYKILFFNVRDGITKTVCIRSFADDVQMAEMCGLPHLGVSTKLVLHVWNHNNYLPDIDIYNLWESSASFKQLIMPPHPEALCRYGDVFKGGSIPVVKYESGIGTSSLTDDIVTFKEIYIPCIPCTDVCSKYNCDESCSNTDGYQLVPFSLTDLTLPTTTNQSLYLLVKAIQGSGTYVIQSSDGFYIDITPPIFDEEVLLYIDTNQGEFTPSDFQGSNITIKALWYCEDDVSEIKEYQWAIGTYVGGVDLQDFVSTGINSTGINDNLEGLLYHNTTYYIRVKCINEAGLTTEFNDTKGVTVLTEPPDVETFESKAVNAEEFDYEVYPATSMIADDPTSFGETWEKSTDPNVARYDFCIGSSKDKIDDIIPCVWISINTSGTVEIKQGKLWLDNIAIYNISELKALSYGIFNYEEEVTQTDNTFNMEPGRTLFLYMKICNKAEICSIKLSNTLLIMGSGTSVLHSTNGEPASYQVDRKRRKRSITDEFELTIDLPAGMVDGQSVAINQLDENDYNTTYTSAASNTFVTYIVDPIHTINKTERRLSKRIVQFDDVFSITSVGQEELPNYLQVTHYQINGNATGDEYMNMLIHWNPDMEIWQISSRSCGHEENNTEHNLNNKTTTVNVCNTRYNSSDLDHDNVSYGYFSKETEFAVVIAYAELRNSAPFIKGTTSFVLDEDSDAATFNLNGFDEDGDEVMFKIEDLRTSSNLVDVVLTENGTLKVTPCVECFGTETFTILLSDQPVYDDIKPAVNIEEITITVIQTNDPPSIHLLDNNWRNMLHEDRTDTVYVYNDVREVEEIFNIGVIVVYDIDGPQNLALLFDTNQTIGEFKLTPLSKDAITQHIRCSKNKCYGTPALEQLDRMDIKGYTLDFISTGQHTGLETIKLVGQDNTGIYSDVLTIIIVMMKNKCVNNGLCKSKNPAEYSCDDVRRTTDFDLYYVCQCTSAWQGQYCENDVNECESRPCNEYQECKNMIGGFECYCEDFLCEMGLAAWAFALIIVACVLVIICIIVPIGIRKYKKDKLRSENYESSSLSLRSLFGKSPVVGVAPIPRSTRPTLLNMATMPPIETNLECDTTENTEDTKAWLFSSYKAETKNQATVNDDEIQQSKQDHISLPSDEGNVETEHQSDLYTLPGDSKTGIPLSVLNGKKFKQPMKSKLKRFNNSNIRHPHLPPVETSLTYNEGTRGKQGESMDWLFSKFNKVSAAEGEDNLISNDHPRPSTSYRNRRTIDNDEFKELYQNEMGTNTDDESDVRSPYLVGGVENEDEYEA